MAMTKSEQIEFEQTATKLADATQYIAECEARIADQRDVLEQQQNALDRLHHEIATLRRDLESVRSAAAAAPKKAAMSKRPIGRVQGEYGFLAIGDTHAFDTQYKSGDVMSDYAIDFYGSPTEAAYLARRTGMPVTTLADGTPRVTVPSQPQAAAIADGARKLVAQDSLATKVRVQAVRATGLQVQDAARGTGAGVTGAFLAIAAPRGAAVSAVDIDGVKGYLIET